MSPILGIYASAQTASKFAYSSIQTVTVGSGGASSITFSSIPSTYTHLQIRILQKTNDTTGSNWTAALQFNGDSATNYSYHGLRGNGTSAIGYAGSSSSSMFTAESIGSSGLPNSSYGFGVGVTDILDYANTNKYKTVRTLTGTDSNGSGQAIIELTSGLWRNTGAVTSITLSSGSPSFVQYSSFALYGVK